MATSTNDPDLLGRAATSLDQHHRPADAKDADKLFAAAAERNKAPILEVMRSRLPASGLVLEVASGTGQHVAWFAQHLKSEPTATATATATAMAMPEGLVFLPTEADESSLPSIRAHTAGMDNVLPPRVLDVGRDEPESWPRRKEEGGGGGGEAAEAVEAAAAASSSSSSSPLPSPSTPYSAVYCANLTHISPFSVTLGLFKGAGTLLEPGGALFLYGPFAVGGRPATPSDATFDASLRAKDSRWGYRDIDSELVPAAVREGGGLMLEERVEMPANNFLLVFRKKKGG